MGEAAARLGCCAAGAGVGVAAVATPGARRRHACPAGVQQDRAGCTYKVAKSTNNNQGAQKSSAHSAAGRKGRHPAPTRLLQRNLCPLQAVLCPGLLPAVPLLQLLQRGQRAVQAPECWWPAAVCPCAVRLFQELQGAMVRRKDCWSDAGGWCADSWVPRRCGVQRALAGRGPAHCHWGPRRLCGCGYNAVPARRGGPQAATGTSPPVPQKHAGGCA